MPGAATLPVELDARVEGTGPTVVLLHGLGGDRTVWNPLIKILSVDFQLVAPDLRGHGRSPLPPGSQFTLSELAADILALLDRLNVQRAHVVGMSAAGFLALRMALDHPSHLRSLILIGSAAHSDAHTRAMGEHWAEVYMKEGLDAYALRLLKDLYYPDWIDQHLDFADRVREDLRHRDLRGAVQWGVNTRDFDVRGQVGRIRLPALIIHGMDDRVVDPSHARFLRQSIPGAELRLFARTGHLVPVERPEEVADAIRTFVNKVEYRVAEPPPSATPGKSSA